jgi:Domain of unknown function (DUF1992)
MTERKPAGQSFTSWIDQQIQEAQDRGAFDDLPGAGKPLPRHPDDDGERWLRAYLRREGVSADEMLPTPLKLRKERARLLESVSDLESEAEVSDAVSELNRRIAEWRRIPLGPPIFVALLDQDEMIARWRAAHRPLAAVRDVPSGPGRPEQRRRRWRRGAG